LLEHLPLIGKYYSTCRLSSWPGQCGGDLLLRSARALADPSVVLFLGGGLLEISGPAASPPGRPAQIWLQVRDVHAEHERLTAAGVRVLREPTVQPWGLTEMWIEHPDGAGIVRARQR
jgi:Glyoxalase/Bleomycin resistance protein/Dioxygenase superfamily